MDFIGRQWLAGRRRGWLSASRAGALILLASWTMGSSSAAGVEVPASVQPSEISISYIGRAYPEAPPLSLVEHEAAEKGLWGARVAIGEINRTGQFAGYAFKLDEKTIAADAAFDVEARSLLQAGASIIVADLEARDLLELADLPQAKSAVILDIRTSDDRLRQTDCRRNTFHILPNWAMRADALAQYLVWKQWRRWFLIKGQARQDSAFAEAIHRAAGKFGGRIVLEKTYAYDPGSRRTDTGHEQIQSQMPLETQTNVDYDVMIVADTADTFGEYLAFNSWKPRPVAGTQGLVATAWHRAFEEYAGTQMQHHFERIASREMTERDYGGWLAVRAIGEAVVRDGATDALAIARSLASDKFRVAGYKGESLSFRAWDHQLRQPVLLTGPRMLVSISPQEGFLHPKFLTDTLGFDEPESECKSLGR